VAGSLWDQLNATMTHRTDIAPGLSVMRVVPDGEIFSFRAGQYCVLGLPPDAPRVEGSGPEEPHDEKQKSRLVRRAYSIASSSRDGEYLEFYVTLVASGEFTPRLFALKEGDRIWVGPKATGLFTLDDVPGTADLLLLATGTGLAPYMSMLRGELLREGEARRIAVAHGARYSWDLGYRAELVNLARRYELLTYMPSITRPGEDPDWRGATGYLQAQLADGRIEAESGIHIASDRTHVFLCGNPSMIEEAVEILKARGLTEWTRKTPEGQIHLEKYW
jgi:ferredoxin--NADP+ reductase